MSLVADIPFLVWKFASPPQPPFTKCFCHWLSHHHHAFFPRRTVQSEVLAAWSATGLVSLLLMPMLSFKRQSRLQWQAFHEEGAAGSHVTSNSRPHDFLFFLLKCFFPPFLSISSLSLPDTFFLMDYLIWSPWCFVILIITSCHFPHSSQVIFNLSITQSVIFQPIIHPPPPFSKRFTQYCIVWRWVERIRVYCSQCGSFSPSRRTYLFPHSIFFLPAVQQVLFVPSGCVCKHVKQ